MCLSGFGKSAGKQEGFQVSVSYSTPTPTPSAAEDLPPTSPTQHRADLVREFLMHKKFYTAHDISEDAAFDLIMVEVRQRWRLSIQQTLYREPPGSHKAC